jgi:hypothetical protein
MWDLPAAATVLKQLRWEISVLEYYAHREREREREREIEREKERDAQPDRAEQKRIYAYSVHLRCTHQQTHVARQKKTISAKTLHMCNKEHLGVLASMLSKGWIIFSLGTIACFAKKTD